MVRHPQTHSLPQTKRRITYKTRLRVTIGDVVECRNVDAEEEEYRLLQRSLGVDKEDIDEKHLQDVLSEAEHAHVGPHEPKAFIPTPGSTATAPDDALHAHYSSRKWDHPQSYICFSDTVDEAIKTALDHGSTYYMDERDKVWLDRNNQDARGESTSTNPCTTSSPASPKGKEPEATVAAIKLSEDEFELVMGLFELITHEQTMLLHHNLELGMEFPPFLMYQDYLSQPLTSRVFAKLWAPSWIPRPPQLVAMAAVVYPHWKARRLDRRGHPIIPTLNFDESDVLNEGYVCFRQREVKAVRRTRASQASPLDKMLALQRQLQQPLEIAQTLAKRESLRQASAQTACNIWLARLEMVELRAKAPELVSKADDAMLVDMNQNVLRRPPIRLRVPPSIKHEIDLPATTGRKVFPRDRTRISSNQMDLELAKREQKDMDWEDVVDSPYVAPYHPPSSRLFKRVGLADPSVADENIRQNYANGQNVRLRMGRNGRTFVDRRLAPGMDRRLRQKRACVTHPDDEARLAEQWRFDADDDPALPHEGVDEHNRILVNPSTTLGSISQFQHDSMLRSDLKLQVVNAAGKRAIADPFPSTFANLPQAVMRFMHQPRPVTVAQRSLGSVGSFYSAPSTPSTISRPSTPLPTPTKTNGALIMPHIVPRAQCTPAVKSAFGSPADVAEMNVKMELSQDECAVAIRKAAALRNGPPPVSSA